MVPSSATPTALQLEAQARFEQEAFDEGVKRYRDALTRDVTVLTAGQRLLREIVPGLAAGITKARAEGVASLTSPSGSKIPWAWPMQLVEEDDRLAVITLGCVLSMPPLERDDDRYRLSEHSLPVTALARHIASGIRMQVEFDRWSEGNEALLRRLRTQFPNLHRNVWRRWRIKVDAMREAPWSPSDEAALGGCLMHLLVQAAPTRFRIELASVRGKPTAHLVISDATMELIDDATRRAEVARPLLMPMTCPPIPWRYE
jgi:hypothetical protein